MTNATVYILRHGEIDNPENIMYGGSKELDLNVRGREQIRKLGEKIKKTENLPSIIYTSPMRRAKESASILAETLQNGALQIVREELIDSAIPALVGKPISVRKEIHALGIDEYDAVYVDQGNEPRAAIINRMFEVFTSSLREHPSKTLAFVSHGDPIRFLLYKLENPDSQVLTPMSILEKTDFLEKGQAWEMIVDENFKIVSRKLMKS